MMTTSAPTPRLARDGLARDIARRQALEAALTEERMLRALLVAARARLQRLTAAALEDVHD